MGKSIALLQEEWATVFSSSSQLALIATCEAFGQVNLAPSGTLVRVNNAPLQICFTVADTSDTARLVLESGEFTAGLVPFEREVLKRIFATAAVRTGTNDETGLAGLHPVDSLVVSVPGIAECYARLEAHVLWTQAWQGRLQVCGQVLAVSIDQNLVNANGSVRRHRLLPAHYLGGTQPARFSGFSGQLLI